MDARMTTEKVWRKGSVLQHKQKKSLDFDSIEPKIVECAVIIVVPAHVLPFYRSLISDTDLCLFVTTGRSDQYRSV